MSDENFPEALATARDLPAIYELVKRAVRQVLQRSRPGIMLALADLGEGRDAWIGGYHAFPGNAIVMNSRPLDHLRATRPDWYKPYAFFILTHEYIHTLGVLDEAECQARTRQVTEALFGPDHLVTAMARDVKQFLPVLTRTQLEWTPPARSRLHYVRGFDRGSTASYIL